MINYKDNYKFKSDISYLFKKTILPEIGNMKVLDLGCGEGEYLKYFSEDSVGYDLASENIKEAKSSGINVGQMDLNNPVDIDDRFDVVFMSHILEHVDCPIGLLRYAQRHLNKNGKLIVSVPNELSLILLKYPYYTNDGNHLYSFSPSNMKELFLSSGFTPTKVYYDYYTSFTRKVGVDRLLSAFDLLPSPLRVPLAWAFWFVGEKA
jgi:2-polyprenyl-3-methyl-5-hydroxy-6-metoxy-1,4-benzoquinol methylase